MQLSPRSTKAARAALAALLCIFLAACSSKVPESKELLEVVQVGPVIAVGDTIRFGERVTGAVRDVDTNGELRGGPVTTLEVAAGGRKGLLDLALEGERTYASWVDRQDQLVVGQIAPGGTRIIWKGPSGAPDNLGGALEVSPGGRLALAIGDMQRPDAARDPAAYEGKVVTLDPDGTETQRPNIVSKGWVDPGGIAYDANEHLWVVDNGDDESYLSRAGVDGPVGTSTKLGSDVAPADLEMFGDSELVVCERNTRRLERYLINDGVEAIPGRLVAEDCAGGVAELNDGRLVYATDTALKITSE